MTSSTTKKLAGFPLAAVLCVSLGGLVAAQSTTTTYTGTIRDLTGAVIVSGQVTFTLAPPSDATIPGVGRFVPLTTTCPIHADGTIGGLLGGPCVVTKNTALSPAGTAYRICVQPNFASPGSCLYDYAVTDTKDLSTVAPTLTTGPLNYNGVPGPPGPGGPGCGTGNCVVTAPATDQTITPAVGYNQLFRTYNCLNCVAFLNEVSQPRADGVNQMTLFTQDTFGPGNHVGFPDQTKIHPADIGESVNKTAFVLDNSRRVGISQTWSTYWNPKHAGDSFWTYIYGNARTAWNSAASEGMSVWKTNNTSAVNYPVGQVTSSTGAGDTAPQLNIGDLAPGSYLIDTHAALAAGTITGNSIQYASTFLYTMPVSNTLAPSTVCATTAYVALSVPVQTPTSHTVGCTLSQGTVMTTGWAWLVSATGEVEQIKVTAASGTGATQTLTFLSAKPHETGSLVIQGGTSGFLSLDPDAASTVGGSQGWRTTHYAFGAADASHYICGKVAQGGFIPCPPYFGVEVSQIGAGYHLYPGAEVLNVDANGNLVALEQNGVAWTAGDPVENPPHVSQLEQDIFIEASVRTPTILGSDAGLMRLGAYGEGVTAAYHMLYITNDSQNPWWNLGGSISPPNFITMHGASAATFTFDVPTGATVGDNCGQRGSILCMRGSGLTTQVDIFRMQDRFNFLGFDRNANRFYMQGGFDVSGDVTTPKLTLTAGTQPLRYGGSITTTAATSDVVTVPGLTTSNYCIVTQQGGGASVNPQSSVIATANQVTVTHAATAGIPLVVSCNIP